MRVVLGSFAVIALTCGLAGCEKSGPSTTAPVESAIPSANLTQVVLEVPGMT